MNFWPVSPGHMFYIALGMFSIPHQFEQMQGDKLDAHLLVLNAIRSFIFFLTFFEKFWQNLIWLDPASS